MKEQEDPPSVFFDDSFKPPDRSTSAPPVLSLHTESLFAFRAAEHLHLFSDIRCEDNYYEFYKKYQNQDKLPPPLQTQPFLVERSFVRPDEEEQQRAYEQQHYQLATEPRNVVHPARANPNPAYTRQNIYDAYDPSRLDDLPADSPTNEAIWTPLYRKMASLVLDEEDKQDKRLPIHQRRDPYYQNDFDVAYSTANQLLKEDNNNNIQSLWNDRAFDNRQHYRNNPSISTPTPIMPSQTSPLLSMLTNGKNHTIEHNAGMGGYFPEVSSSPIDGVGLQKISPKRRASSGERINLVPPSTTPPLPGSSNNPQSPSPSLPTCRYYAQGYCSRGDRCNFSHEADSSQPQSQQPLVAAPAPITPSVTPPPSSVSSSIMGGDRSIAESALFNKHGSAVAKPKKATTPSPPLPQGGAGLGLGMLGSLGPPPGMQLVDNISAKKAPAQSRSPAPRPSNGPTEITFPNGHMSPSVSSPAPLSPTGSNKADLTRQYTSIEQVVGHIYSLCKDQHGCRFLQKKLEDREPNVAEYIFAEVYDHMTELMTDPFGNYLCQKLLEHCDDAQRLEVIQRVSNDLVKISKNMHGTRAVQKMIEYLTTPAQIALIKKALANSVVTLIQDLNGNHVIQRCLNRLSPQDNQFIYDSVSQAGHCVEVATHRHGCCVLQRCIDHASDSQKMQLINEVIANALVLVQDPYGNYVVQYVLDLAFPGLASELARRFLGHIPILSTQKFSSNVIEKCLNVADASTRAVVIQELVEYDNLLYLLQDPYANYVIQTSLNVSEPMQHARLVEAIRPHLTSLRNTPYGKRIQNKIIKESSRDYYA